MIICVLETHSWSFQTSEVTGTVFVLVDKVKSFDISKENFDMSNVKATEGQIRERKIHVYTWTSETETMQGQHQKEVSLI